MSYIENIQADLKAAMLNKESDKVRTLRMLISKLREKKIALMKDLEETGSPTTRTRECVLCSFSFNGNGKPSPEIDFRSGDVSMWDPD